MTALECIPGDPEIVHHVLIFRDRGVKNYSLDSKQEGPGYICFGGAGTNDADLIAAWVPGSGAFALPAGFGMKIPARSNIIIQVHYPAGVKGRVDQTKVKFKLTDQPQREAFLLPALNHVLSLTNGPLIIPANTIKTFNPQAATAAAPADAAAVPAPPPPAAAVTKETVDNPYGLSALWAQGDFVSRRTLIILVIMSMGSWYILVTKLYESFKIAGEAKAARKGFFKAANLQEGAKTLKKGSAFRYIAESGMEASEHHEGALTEHIDRNTWISMSVQRSVDTVQSRLQDGLAFLATVGSTAPFVGLLGTVWGIYHALAAIGIAGQASIDKVAGPVGEALIMTAIGLAVAVPAVLAYNWLVRRNKVAMEHLRGYAADLHLVLVAGAAKKAKAQSTKMTQP